MSNYLESAATVLVPLLVFLLPGMFLRQRSLSFLNFTARAVLTSLSFFILSTYLLALLHIPVVWALFLALVIAAINIIKTYRDILQPHWWWTRATSILLLVVLYALFTLPFLHFHAGLPTGDSQKAVLWAQDSISTHALPDYQRATTFYNRDPIDFYTPGLHTLTALILTLTPDSGDFTSVGLLAILLSIATALTAAAITKEIVPTKTVAVLLTLILILTNLRFLRYLREPGYHLQNVLGEVLLFSIMLLLISLIKRWSTRDALLAGAAFVALILSHQFSTFISVVVIAPLLLCTLLARFKKQMILQRHHRLVLLAGLVFAAALVGVILSLELSQKIPHIFTANAHLSRFVPSLMDYSILLGPFWIIAGSLGLLYLASTSDWQHKLDFKKLGLVGAVLCLLALSQAPRFGIDIPPVRALFYSIVPLSISAAIFIAAILERARYRIAKAIVWLVIISAAITSTTAAYSLSHSVRTNSTLLPEQLELIRTIQQRTTNPLQAVLIDDYNRRSTSWMVLSGQPLLTRIAADLEVQMNEAGQSTQRYNLYLNQLDYEKILDLGSLPDVAPLLAKHKVTWLTGIASSSATSLAHNPLLTSVTEAGDTTLYEVQPHKTARSFSNTLSSWLLRPTTIVNDIGDAEDTFEHLPISLRATRLSEPHIIDNTTSRTTTAPLITFRFNVGDFVRYLWDREQQGKPNTAVELLLRFTGTPSQLILTTSTGQHLPITNETSLLRLENYDVPFEKDGFITITLKNPTQQPVTVDVVALGLAHTP